jgi:hypothetical protein
MPHDYATGKRTGAYNPAHIKPMGVFDPQRLVKTFDFAPGKWRWSAGVKGHRLIGIDVVDIRGRRFALTRMAEEPFRSLVPFSAKGGADPDVHLRGVPHIYCVRKAANDAHDWFVYIWPAPVHAWRFECRYERIKKEGDEEEKNEGQCPA